MELPDNMTNASPDVNTIMTWDEAQRLKLRGAYFNEVNIKQIWDGDNVVIVTTDPAAAMTIEAICKGTCPS